MYNEMSKIVSNQKFKLSLSLKIIIVFIVIFLIIIVNTKITNFDIYDSVVIKKEDDYYVQVLVPMDIQTFYENSEILVNDKKYTYEVVGIDENRVIYDNKQYKLVNICTNIDKKLLVENNYIKIKQVKENQSVLKIILKRIKEGIN